MSRFDWTLTSSAHNQGTSALVHHPWRMANDGGNQRKIDSFLARSKRRKHPSWGSDTSTIYTESTGNSSQSSSQSSSSSPTQVLRKIDEPHPSSAPSNRSTIQPPTNPPNHDQNRDPRNSINPHVAGERKPPQHQRSFSENNNNSAPRPVLPRFERGVFRCDTDLVAPLPPRSPCVSPLPPIASTRKTLASEQKQPKPKVSEPPVKGKLGPIDVDTLEAYHEEGSVESLAMMGIDDPSETVTGSSTPIDPPKPGMAIRQGTCDSFAYSVCTAEGFEEEEEEEEYDSQDDSPLNPLMKLEKLDLLAESDDEEDYKQIRTYMKSFPILDERHAERILCGYCRGFEPEIDEEGGQATRKGAFEI